MPRWAILYPRTGQPEGFGLPGDRGKPFVSIRYNRARRWSCFARVLRKAPTNPAAYSGFELSTELKCTIST